MKTNHTSVLLIMLCLGVAGYTIWSAWKSRPAEPEVKPERTTVARATEKAHVMSVASTTFVNAGNPNVNEMLDAFSTRRPEDVFQVARKRPSREQLNKEARERVDRQIRDRRRELDAPSMIYAELFARLNLPADKLAILKDLLVEYEFAGKVIGLGYRDSEDFIKTGQIPEGESYKRITALREEIKANIATLLGDDACSYTMHYYDTLYQRGEANAINSYFNGKVAALTREQTDGLIEILYNRVGICTQAGIPSNDIYSVYKYHKQYTVEKASAILTPSQLSALSNYYDKKIQWAIENTTSGKGKKL